jgi:hypothetical protein
MLEPHAKKSKIEAVEPKLVWHRILKLEPSLHVALKDNEEPKSTKSKTDMLDPTLTVPTTVRPDPNLTIFLKLKVLPKLMKSRIEIILSLWICCLSS